MISLVILSDANGVSGQFAGWGRKNPRICFSASVAAHPLSLPSHPVISTEARSA